MLRQDPPGEGNDQAKELVESPKSDQFRIVEVLRHDVSVHGHVATLRM